MEKVGAVISARLLAVADGEENREWSASGLLLDAQQGHVITTASWLRHVLKLYSKSCQDGSVASSSWNLRPGVQFHVLLAESRDLMSEWREAQLVAVHFVSKVYETLAAFVQLQGGIGGGRGSVVSRDQTSLQQEDITGLLYSSSVVLLKVTLSHAHAKLKSSCSELTIIRPSSLPAGHPLSVVSTPFGSLFPDVFRNSVSQGCLSNHFSNHGDGGCVFIIDARCVAGSEGGVILNGTRPRRKAELVGMVVTQVSGLSGGSTGMSLCISMECIAQALSPHLTLATILKGKESVEHCLQPLHPPPVHSVVMVTSRTSWGSGVLLFSDVVLTCAHVLLSQDGVSVRWPGSEVTPAEVLYASASSTAPDIALLRLTPPSPHSSSSSCLPPRPLFTSWQDMEHLGEAMSDVGDQHGSEEEEEVVVGRDVLAIGYCLQGPSPSTVVADEREEKRSKRIIGPSVTRGVVAKLVMAVQGLDKSDWERRRRRRVVMVQSTAAVHNGMSGGLLWQCCHGDGGRGLPLALLVSHAREDDSGTTHPAVSFAVPFSWVCGALMEFLATRDEDVLKSLSSEEVSQLWRLQDSKSFVPSSHL